MQHIINGNWIIHRDTRREYILDIISVDKEEPRAEVKLETVETSEGVEIIEEEGMWHLKNTHLRGVWTLLKKYNYKRMPGGHRYLKVVSKEVDGTLILKEYLLSFPTNALDDPYELPLEEIDKLKNVDLVNGHFRIRKTLKDSQGNPLKDEDGKTIQRNYGTVHDLDTANKVYDVMTALDDPEEFVTSKPVNKKLQEIQEMCKKYSVEEVLDWIQKEYDIHPRGSGICNYGYDNEKVQSTETFVLTESQFEAMCEQKFRQMMTEMKGVFRNGDL